MCMDRQMRVDGWMSRYMWVGKHCVYGWAGILWVSGQALCGHVGRSV